VTYVARYLPLPEIERVLEQAGDDRVGVFAGMSRINCLYMIQKAGSGHIGTSFSSMDILSRLYLEEIEDGDIFFSSKGHDVPAIYSILLGLGRLDFELIHQLRRLDGLPGHPDVSTPHIVTNTGSLGMGISKARGMAHAKSLDGKQGRVYVLMGDGELQEGQVYESLQPTVNGSFSTITVIVDHNKIQSDTWVEDVSSLGGLAEKFASFGWAVGRCDGHNDDELESALASLRSVSDRPQILIADTVKGKGVSNMEQFDAEATGGQYPYHSGALSSEEYEVAFAELDKALNRLCLAAGIATVSYEEVKLEAKASTKTAQNLMTAYSQTLVELGDEDDSLVVLDADLALDCGLISFRSAHPDRFVECGIAEMDMVSMAGGLALSGKLPVVHSFACFLSTRPGEQIFNNATERTKIIYSGTLAGLLPAAPGHSHQSVRDIALLGNIPGMTLIEPSCEAETKAALEWAVRENKESSYLRLVIVPCEIDYELPSEYFLCPGKGCVLRDGSDAVVFAYGPVMLQQAFRASTMLDGQGVSLQVVNLPWLNKIDFPWFEEVVGGMKKIFTIDDHLVTGGQGQLISAAAGQLGLGVPVVNLGLTDIPACGQPDEVLKKHGLDAESLSTFIRQCM